MAIITMYGYLGFSPTAIDIIYITQDMDNLSNLTILSENQCEAVCKLLYMPGETITKSSADVAGQSATTPTSSYTIWM